MTYLEKLKNDHPDWDTDNIIEGRCPDWDFSAKVPDYCNTRDEDCRKCWNRNIPGTYPTPIIKDSGERRQFDTGAVRDIQEGKGRCDLMPLDVVAIHMENHILLNLASFQETANIDYLYKCLISFSCNFDDGKCKASPEEIETQRYCTMFLEVAKHFEDGAEKYGENNWQKGIPVRCYIDSAVRHYLKWLRGDDDEPHDRAFCWNILCAIWTCKHKPELNDYNKEETE